ncbi:GNAT family N-acetyltransferase [Mycoplasmatota bacterium WC30]
MIEYMKLIYNEDAIIDLYLINEWYAYTNSKEVLLKGIKNSLDVYGAYDKDKLVGLIRTVGDRETIIYIQDILINQDYQRKGIGTKLINIIIDKYQHVRQIVLVTDQTQKQIEFYKSVGFIAIHENGGVAFKFKKQII